MPISAINAYGKGFFDKHFEILEGGPKEDAPKSEDSPLVKAMIELMDKGEVSKKTGMPSCKDLSIMLERDVSKEERDSEFEKAFEEEN